MKNRTPEHRVLFYTILALPLATAFPARAATITWTNIAGGNWSTTTNWSPNQVPGASDTAVITVAGIGSNPVNVTLDVSPAVGGLTLGAGGGCGGGQVLVMNAKTITLGGALVVNACGHLTLDSGSLAGGAGGNATLSGAIGWTGGVLAGTLTLATNCTLNVSGVNDHDLPGCTLTNYGTIAWSGGRLRGGGAGTQLYNFGLFDAQSDHVINADYGGNGVVFKNFGTFRKSVGAGSTTFTAVPFNNAGAADVQSGTLLLNSGGTFSPGSVMSGAGGVQLASGVFTLNVTISSTNVQQTGGTLTGTNLINGPFTWVVGNWNGASSVTLSSNTTLSISSANDHDLASCILTNLGVVLWSGGRVRGGSGGTLIYNFGQWTAQSDQVMNADYGGNGMVFNNLGTFRKSAGTSSTTLTSVVFNNPGAVDVQSGTLAFNGGGSGSGSYTAEAGATMAFGANYAASSGAVLTGPGTNLLNSGVFTLNTVMTVSNGVLQGATLAGTAGVVSGLWTWTGGNIGASGSSLTLASNSLMRLVGQNGVNYDLFGTLSNAGTLRLASGILRFRGDGQGQLVNLAGGLVDVQANLLIDAFNSPTTAFVNQGTLRKSAGTGTATVNSPFFNPGAVDVQSGELTFNGGGSGSGSFTAEAGATLAFGGNYTAASGAVLTGAGTNLLTAGIFTLNSTMTVSNGVLAGATLAGTNGVISGLWNWTSGNVGVLGGTLTLAGNTVMLLAGQNGVDYDLFGTMTNAGTLRLASGILRLRGDGQGRLVNLAGALVDVQADVTIDSFSSPTAFINLGTLRKSGGVTTATLIPPFVNSGTIDAQSGNLSFNGGGTFNPGSVISGAGGVQFAAGAFTLNVTITSLNVQQTGGTLAGINVINGPFSWVSGNWNSAGPITLGSNALLTISSVSDHDLASCTVSNFGAVLWTGGRVRGGSSGSFIHNFGLWTAQSDQAMNSDYLGNGLVFNNLGTFRKSTGTNSTTLTSVVFNNPGAVDVQSGTFALNGGGSGSGSFTAEAGATMAFGANYTANGGAVLSGPGTNLLTAGTFTLNTTMTVSNGVLTGAALAGTNGLVSGLWNWTSGNIGALGSTLTLASNTVMTLAGQAGVNYDLFGTLTNAGSLRLTGGTLRLRGDSQGKLVNLPGALVDVQANLLIDAFSSPTAFINQGTLRKSGGTGTATVNPPFSNLGTVDSQAGILSLPSGSTLTGGTLNFGIGSLTNFGQINLVGSATLTGTVSANFNNGYEAAAGSSFAVLTYGSRSGIFTATSLPLSVAWQTNYAATVFTLSVLNARPNLTPIPLQVVNELATLTVNATATDPDLPAQTLTFTLLSGPPGLALSNTAGVGVITWTPAQTNSPSTNTVTVAVTDNGVPPLSATNSFTVVVKEVNVPPTLPIIAAQTVNELTLLTVTNTASEFNIHSVTTGYGLINPPLGAAINANGIITWTPAQTQSPGTNLFTTIVTNSNPYDLINPSLTATNTFTVIVKEVNVAPILPVIPNQTVTEHTLLTVTNTASESNIHATLSYAFLSAPAGMSISTNGIITWVPSQAQTPGTNTVTTVVTSTDPYDVINPQLSATNSFIVFSVRPVVVLTGPRWLGNGQFQFSFNTITGITYTVQSSTNLINWRSNLTLNGSGGPLTNIDNTATNPYLFYRVKIGP